MSSFLQRHTNLTIRFASNIKHKLKGAHPGVAGGPTVFSNEEETTFESYVDWRDRRLIKNLYTDQRATVRLGNAYSPLCMIGRGTRQGCPLSPLLFNIYVDELMRRAMEGCQDGVLIGGRLVNAN